MPEQKQSAKLNQNSQAIDTSELLLQRVLLVGLTILFLIQFVLDLSTREVTLPITLIIFSIVFIFGALFVLSYKSQKFKMIFSSKQYLIYALAFIVNFVIDQLFNNHTLNHSLAIGLGMIAIIKSESIKQILVNLFISCMAFYFYNNVVEADLNTAYFSIYLSLGIGVSILQGVKVITEKRYSTFEKSISSIFNNLSEPIFIVSKRTLNVDYCNSFARAILKCREGQMETGLPFFKYIAPSSMPIIKDIIKRMDEGLYKDWEGEIEMITVTNENIWVLFKINKVRFPDDEKFIIKVVDISKSKFYETRLKDALVKTETQNKELESTKRALINVMEDLQLERDKAFSFAGDLEKFRLAVDSASDHIVITDPDGIVLYANPAVTKITGYTVEETLGTKAGKLWSLPMDKEFYEKLWDTVKNQKKIFEGEIQNKKKNGEKYFAQVSISPVLNEKKEVEFLVGIERDITKAKEIDNIRSEFVSVASHQLRTPLTSIKWYIELLHEGNENFTDAQRDIFKEIETSNSRMITLVNDLLNVSRIEKGEKYVIVKEWGNIIEVLKSVSADQQILAQKKNINIVIDTSGFNEFLMSFDKPKLYQSISNLINNAIKYSYENSTIDLVLKQNSNNEILISVSDHGIGIPEASKGRIFDRFFRAENAIKVQTDGNGLGLYFARAIVQDHGGQMWFDSVEGQGTTFTIKLPIK